MAEDQAASERAERHAHAEGGEPVCWLPLVCFECGRVRQDLRTETCEHCGAAVEP